MSDSPDLTPEDVKEILRLVDESQFDEFELETPRITIRFRRGEPAERESAVAQTAPAETQEGLVDVTAPMVGTFYRAPGPGESPFVELGSSVEADTQVCILEVMKLMSAVVAGRRGVVAEVSVANGSAVAYGDLLFRIRPA
ncbi:MAG TPA: biotin/lipoyl-containing protein [Gaiellales bacterium]|jgi:acetyl-CoA carboxylase biotin carboxyl carrier protein|nr:biotin/lipoyl-containing protein [Gaiellales bacterium]